MSIIKRRGLLLVSLLLLVSGLGLAGCGVPPQQQYTDMVDELAAARKDLAAARAETGAAQEDAGAARAELVALQKEYEALKSRLSSAQNDIEKAQASLAARSAALDDRQKALSDEQKKVSQLEARLDTIMDTRVMFFYRFQAQFFRNDWVLPVPLRTYFSYREKSRPDDPAQDAALVLDADADGVMDALVRFFKDAAIAQDMKKSDTVNMVARFTQALPGVNKDVATPFDDYARYPVETLFEQSADSEDASILAAAILSRLGFDVVLLYYPDKKHMAVGVNVASSGYSWEYKAKRYYYLETTGDAWQSGEIPNLYREVRPTIVPLAG
ncbi:MAG: hypothetical protein HYX96_01930 [Chloroflexi bacterium]|nr:hypothetical protein [Chloroflexota bacterium]